MTGRPHISEKSVSGRRLNLPLVRVVAGVQNKQSVRIPWHSHGYFELLFVLDGGTAYEFADGGRLDLVGGQFFVVPPRAEHRGLHNLRTPSNVCGLGFHSGARHASRHTPFSSTDLKWLCRQFSARALVVRPMGKELRQLVLSLSRQRDNFEANAAVPGSLAGFRATACLVILQAAHQLGMDEPHDARRLARSVLAYVEAHYQDSLRATDLARAAGCSRSRLFQIFRQSTGMTPADYIQRRRVEKVRILLTDSHRSITDIAFESGFSSSQYLCKVFKKYAGTTPRTFRFHRPKDTTG